MALQHHGLAVFIAGTSGFLDEYIAHSVYLGIQAEVLAELHEESMDFLFPFGGAGHSVDLCKAVENDLRRELRHDIVV